MVIPTIDRPVSVTMAETSPTERVEPITLDQAKRHLRRQGFTHEDEEIVGWIAAARTYFEEQTGRQCVDATWEYALDATPDGSVIELPRPPLASVVSVTYDDANGVEQTVDPASYRVLPSFIITAGSPTDTPAIDAHCRCGRLELVSGAAWPTTNGRARSLRIRRVCGYGATAAAMPPLLQATLLLLLGHFYSHREEVTDQDVNVLPLGAQTLIVGFKWTAMPTSPPATCLWPTAVMR